MNQETWKKVQAIAHELVDAEALPCYEPKEIAEREAVRKKALQCMRQIGKREYDKIGKEENWGM